MMDIKKNLHSFFNFFRKLTKMKNLASIFLVVVALAQMSEQRFVKRQNYGNIFAYFFTIFTCTIITFCKQLKVDHKRRAWNLDTWGPEVLTEPPKR